MKSLLKMLLGLLLISCLVIGCAGPSGGTTFDVLIKDGTVYDGTLAPPKVADIGIKGDKIIAIGTNLDGTAKKTIDAKGYIITPGFIDVHTHSDLSFIETGLLSYAAFLIPQWKGNQNYTYQGVTTVVTGNCGYGYTDTQYWLNRINSLKFGTNVYHLAPHGAIRQELFGEDQPEKLAPEQLAALKRRIAEEMEKGAIGFSAGLEYTPGFLSNTEELIEVAKVVKGYGGIFTVHIRDESGTIYEGGQIGVLEAIKEAIEVSRSADIPVQISHLKICAPINNVRASQLLELIEEARKEGLDITADQYPYNASMTRINILLPKEYVTHDGVREEFKTTEGRAQLKKAIERTFSYVGPEKVLISRCPEKKDYDGKTLKQIADAEGRSPSEVYVELVCFEKSPFAIFFDQDMGVVRELMPYDYVFTSSDGYTNVKGMSTPHPRVYGTFTRKIKQFALDEKLIDLKATIRSMTSLPAEKFKMKGRGKIAEGYFADIAVINLNTIRDKATYERPDEFSEGIVYLLVNGVLTIENGKATGKTGGRGLKRE